MLVKIGGKTYRDNEIINVSISYGKSDLGLAPVVPTATVQILGKLPLSYNVDIEISTSIYGISKRFVGRVGAQSYTDKNNKVKITSISATGHTIRLFRDETIFNAYNSINTLGHAVQFMYNRASLNKVPGGSKNISKSMWAKDYFSEIKNYTSKEVLQIFEQVGVGVLHNRDGSHRYVHPQDRLEEMATALATAYPLQRSEALSPATHEQVTSYIDARPRLVYYLAGDDTPQYADIFSKYFRGVEIPRQVKDTEIKDFVYSTDAWKYPARINLMQNAVKKWSTPSITVDMLMLKIGNSYDQKLFTQLANLNEGEFIIFSGDWDGELRGAKVVQGISETITAQGWDIEFSLGDPSAVIGYSEIYDPMPAPREITWNQKTSTWDTEPTRWDEN